MLRREHSVTGQAPEILTKGIMHSSYTPSEAMSLEKR